MTNVEDIAKETIDILKYFDNDFISKIPENFMKKLQEISKASSLKVEIDASKKLEEQNVSEDCKNFISWIYYSYCADENEKKEIQEKWKINEQKYQEEISKKYNVFNESANIINNENEVNADNMANANLNNNENNLPVLAKKQNIFEKIFEFFKSKFIQK